MTSETLEFVGIRAARKADTTDLFERRAVSFLIIDYRLNETFRRFSRYLLAGAQVWSPSPIHSCRIRFYSHLQPFHINHPTQNGFRAGFMCYFWIQWWDFWTFAASLIGIRFMINLLRKKAASIDFATSLLRQPLYVVSARRVGYNFTICLGCVHFCTIMNCFVQYFPRILNKSYFLLILRKQPQEFP